MALNESSIEALLGRISEGGYVLPSEAAQAIRDLERLGRVDSAEIRARIFGALGAKEDYAISWSHIDHGVAESVHLLARIATDNELWLAVAALAREYRDSDYWPDSVASNLNRLALERAKVRGLDELLVGLSHHLAMHSRWAFGGGPYRRESSAALPDREVGLSWRNIAVRLLSTLFASRSVEVLEAAADGMHSLVATDSSVVSSLFESLETAWQRRWLLIAAEPWAALYPAAIEAVQADLERTLHEGRLQERLQAWIILCKWSETVNSPRPAFPLPNEPADTESSSRASTIGLLHVPPTPFGQRSLLDRFSGVESTLRDLYACGWDLTTLKGVISQRLSFFGETTDDAQRIGPHRHGDFVCTLLDSDDAVGDSILSILSTSVCDETGIMRQRRGCWTAKMGGCRLRLYARQAQRTCGRVTNMVAAKRLQTMS